jgi:hypothetical protein
VTPEQLERWKARKKDTRARFGIDLPIVDYVDPAHRAYVPNEDELALFVVNHFRAELNAFEVIVEYADLDRIQVLFAGMTGPPGRRFLEWRLDLRIVEYRNTHTFSIASQEKILDRNDKVRVNTPRWVTRKP